MITTLRASSGHYLCAESGGGTVAVADRVEAGPWEQWTVHTYDDGRVSLQAHNGLYLCAEPDGTVIVNRVESGEYERFTCEVRDVGVAFKSYRGYLQAPQGGGTAEPVRCVGDDPTLPGVWEFFVSSADWWTPAQPVHPDPLVGQLTTDGDRCFRDDTGPRLVCIYHGGDLFALYCAGKVDTVRSVFAEVAAAGYHVVRSWVSLNDALDPDNVWAGPDYLGVGPTHTEDYTGKLVGFANLLTEYGLRWHMAAGGLDGMDIYQERGMFHEWADAMTIAGPEKWALVEALNEARDTGDGDGDNTPEHLEYLINIVRDQHPQVLYTLTAYTGTEDPADLEPYQPSWVRMTYYHGYRGGEIDDKIRHRVSMALESGLGRLFWDGEPGGPWNQQGIPGDPLTSVSAQENDHEYDDESVAAMHMGTIIGHGATAFMCSTGVRHYTNPSTFPGFASMPRLLRLIPQDVHRGETVHAGRSNSPIEPTTNADGDLGRADSLLLPDGRVVSILYGENPGRYDYRLREGLRGHLVTLATGAFTPIDIGAGGTLSLDIAWGVGFIGATIPSVAVASTEVRLRDAEFYIRHLLALTTELQQRVRRRREP